MATVRCSIPTAHLEKPFFFFDKNQQNTISQLKTHKLSKTCPLPTDCQWGYLRTERNVRTPRAMLGTRGGVSGLGLYSP